MKYKTFQNYSRCIFSEPDYNNTYRILYDTNNYDYNYHSL